MKRYFIILQIAILFITGTAGAQVLNIERERIKTDTTGWSGTAKVSLDIIRNTKEFTQAGLGIHVQYKTERSLYLALSDYELIKSVDDDFSNRGLQHLRYNYKLSKVVTLEAFSQAQFNKVLNIDFRGLLGAGPRFKVLGMDNMRIYAGTAYMFEYEQPKENPAGDRNHRASNYVSFTFRLSDNLTLINTSYFQPRLDLISDYRLSHNLDLLFKISRNLSYSMALEHLTDTRPAEGIPQKVYAIRNKLVFTFGR